jgi:hypothetical protein
MERAEPLAGINSPLDRPVVLLHDIMPPPGLCRALRVLAQPAWFLAVPDAA